MGFIDTFKKKLLKKCSVCFRSIDGHTWNIDGKKYCHDCYMNEIKKRWLNTPTQTTQTKVTTRATFERKFPTRPAEVLTSPELYRDLVPYQGDLESVVEKPKGNFFPLLPVTVSWYRPSSKEELYLLGESDFFPLALYRNQLYKIRHHRIGVGEYASNTVQLWHQGKGPVVSPDQLTAVFMACFDVRYKGVWYRSSWPGGKDAEHVVTVIYDEENRTGLWSIRFDREFGWHCVELEHDQIEEVRLCLSDPLSPEYLKEIL